jgi:hypothetical protein
MPYYWANWQQVPHADTNMLNIALNTAHKNPDTIVEIYYRERPETEKIPNLNRLNNAVNKYINLNKILDLEISSIIQHENTLCVHLRSGDYGIISNDFTKIVFDFSKKFKKVIILFGLNRSRDLNIDSENNIKSKNNLHISLNNLLNMNNNIYAYDDIPDVHICLMSIASNLLLHKGGFSIIGSFINNNNIFITNEFFAKNSEKWKKEVKNKKIKVI